jgi:endonuclease YncB( thermonuclease family)
MSNSPPPRRDRFPAVPPSPERARERRAAGARRLLLGLAALVAVGCDGTLRPGGQGQPPPGQPTGIATGAIVAARVTRVHDGDSFDARLVDGRRAGIRIAAIDAPERRQAFADVSRRHLVSMIGGREVRIEVLAVDRYDRAVARISLLPGPGTRADGESDDVGREQIRRGMAWYFRRYEPDLPAVWRYRYDLAEHQARAERAGLWQEPAPVEPWRYREGRRAPVR